MKTIFRKSIHGAGGFPGAVLLAISVFITAVLARMLVWDSSGNLITHSYSVWGDWSVHFTYISQFRERGMGWVFGDNPLFHGTPFQYPFLSHFLTQAFAAFGAGLGVWGQQEVVLPAFILSLMLIFLLPFALYFGYRAISLKPWTAVLSTFLFLFVGGLQFLDQSVDSNNPLTNQPGGPYFTNFLLFELFPQRAFLFGLIGFLFLGGWLLKRPNASRLGVGLLIFPFFLWLHVHTWIALAFFLMCLFVFPIERKKRMPSLYYGLAIAVVSLILMKVYLFRAPLPEAFQEKWAIWSPGWFPEVSNLFWFWLYQTGIFIPLALYGFYLFRNKLALRPFFATGVLLFVVAFFIRFQPAAYDNLKLFTYSFFFLTPFVALAIESFFKKNRRHSYLNAHAILPALIIISLTWSGISDVFFFAQDKQTTVFFKKDEFDLAETWKNIRSSSDDIVLIAPIHNHWVPCLTGSPVWMGYPGWLWSWGIHYGPREQEVAAVLTGSSEAQKLIDNNHVRYAILNQHDRIQNKPINLDFFKTHYQSVFEKDGWFGFDLTKPLSEIAPSKSVR